MKMGKQVSGKPVLLSILILTGVIVPPRCQQPVLWSREMWLSTNAAGTQVVSR